MPEIAAQQGFGAEIAAKSSAFSAAKLLIYKDVGGAEYVPLYSLSVEHWMNFERLCWSRDEVRCISDQPERASEDQSKKMRTCTDWYVQGGCI